MGRPLQQTKSSARLQARPDKSLGKQTGTRSLKSWIRALGNRAMIQLLSPHDLSKTRGEPLDPKTRAQLEPAVGYSLRRVRVHDDHATHRTAAGLNARAFTVGDHIGFSKGAYAPHSPDGQRILAHEISHVKQAYEGRINGPSRFVDAGDSLENEARGAQLQPVDSVAKPRFDLLAPPLLGSDLSVLALTISLNTGGRVTDSSPGVGDNVREDVLYLLDRLHTMWSISNANYNNQYHYVHARPRGSQIPLRDASPPAAAGVPAPWSFQPTIDAIARNSDPSLAGAVIRRYMGIPVNGSVGEGSANVREDALAVMARLNFLSNYPSFTRERAAVSALPVGSNVPDAMLAGTFAEITSFKEELVAGTLGIEPMHGNEREYGGVDRYAGQTSEVRGGAVTFTPAGESEAITRIKLFSVFVPRGVRPNRNKVHLFFTPFMRPQEFVAQQGLRAQYDDSEWILIGIPSLYEHDRPNVITISTAEIQACLNAAGRGTGIDAIRMSAHSRGQRGLAHTLGVGARRPTIDLGLVEGVTIFDASYQVPGRALRAHLADLTRMQDPANPRRFAAGAINLYDVTVGNVSGFPGTRMHAARVRGLAYVRLVEEGLARGEITRGSLAGLPANTRDATTRLLAAIPNRGRFSTRSPTPSGMTDLNGFLSRHRRDLAIVDNAGTGLKPFITANNLDWGAGYDRHIDAHHWFVAELAHEAVR